MITNPSNNNIDALTIGKAIPVSDIVVRNRSGGVAQLETKLFSAKTKFASSHILYLLEIRNLQ